MPLVARYADVWNVPTYALRDWPALTGVLEKQCARVERNPGLIRRSHQAVLAVAVSSFVFMVGAKQAAATLELFAAEIMPRL
jgi:hypothetical protein